MTCADHNCIKNTGCQKPTNFLSDLLLHTFRIILKKKKYFGYCSAFYLKSHFKIVCFFFKKIMKSKFDLIFTAAIKNKLLNAFLPYSVYFCEHFSENPIVI